MRKGDPSEIYFDDLKNPWTFSNLCLTDDETFFDWLRRNCLLASTIKCHCGKHASLNKRAKSADGYSFRCSRGHEFSMRKYSFFQGSSYNIRDLFLFMKLYLDGDNLHQCALNAGMDYKTTAVNWASYVREIFVEYVSRNMFDMKFEGEVEIDESLFGRKVKYNRGNPTGHRIWIFGLIERSSNRIILYPVDNRREETLIPIIQRHVVPGSTIFSDSWAAYFKLQNFQSPKETL